MRIAERPNVTAKPWPFRDPPNLAVIVHRKVMSREEAIALVAHGEDDGGWQFLSHETGPLNASDGVVNRVG